MDKKIEHFGVMLYTSIKWFAAILKSALVYTALKLIISFVMLNWLLQHLSRWSSYFLQQS